MVEKCLRCCEESRSRIVPELLTVPHFDQLLQHPFSNYVVQSALEVTKVSPKFLASLIFVAIQNIHILFLNKIRVFSLFA